MAAGRRGALDFAAKDYMIRTGPIVVPRGCGIRGKAGLMGVFASEAGIGIATRLLNDSNHDTVHLSDLNTYCEGIIFAGPQPVFQASISSNGGISVIGARYAGYGLRPGNYGLIIDGGIGVGAAGTVTVGPDGKVARCTLTAPGQGYMVGGPLAMPRVRAKISGGNQGGAHIDVTGAEMWRVENCAFLSKGFGLLCNVGHVIKTCSGSYVSSGNPYIPVADTSGIADFMVVNNVTNPQSLRQFNQIPSSGITANTRIKMSYPVDEGSAGGADTLIIGAQAYFVKGVIKGCSFWGSTYWQIYGNWAAENVDIHDSFFVNPENGSVFCGSGLAVTFERNNIDGVFGPTSFAAQFIAPPRSIKDNTIGNITGSAAAKAPALYISGRLVFGGAVVASGMTVQGNQLYAPLARGIMLESVVGATFIGNPVSTYNPESIPGCFDLHADSASVGNTFIFGADAGPNARSRWSIPSQNWVIGPWGMQKPYVKVSTNYAAKWYDHTIAVDAASGNKVVSLPSLASGLSSSNAGLEFTVIKTDSSTHAVTASGDNVSGAASWSTASRYGTATFTRADTNEWYITGH
jgi:hypothetical protein